MSGVWSSNVRVNSVDLVLTLRLTNGSSSGRQETAPDDCRLNGAFSEITGTGSRVTMTFRPDDADCTEGRGTLTLTTKSNNSLLAEFHPDRPGGSWDTELHAADRLT